MVEYFRTSKVKKDEAWYTLTSSFLKTIEYQMKATRLINTQYEKVTKPLLAMALKKVEILRTFPRVMVYILKNVDIYFNSLYRTSRNGNNTSQMG